LNIKTVKNIINIILIVLILGSCKSSGESVVEYFWPLKEGQVFIYELQDGSKRIVRLSRIMQEPGKKDIKVETDEKYENVGPPIVKQDVKNIYIIALDSNEIYTSTKDQTSPSKMIQLKGPIQTGTKWPFTWIIADPEKNDTLTGRGMCRIKDIRKLKVLGEDASCITVSCPIVHDEITEINNRIHCKGIGYVQTETTSIFKGKEMNPFMKEKLLETRK
jgi:hypothetical protein